MDFGELKENFQDFLDRTQDYFSHLSQEERYGWIGEGIGLALLIAGIVLLGM